jgi:hypothetical protein
MRTTHRDRRGPAVTALCAALVGLLALVPAAGALQAEYHIFPNGTAYAAEIGITGASRYQFADTGFLGDSVPITVSDVQLAGNCSPCRFNWSSSFVQPSTITFPEGNYTLSYIGPLKDYNLQRTFDEPYDVNVTLPAQFDVRNPLLAGLSQGASVTRFPDNTTLVRWNGTMSFDLRFYDQGRESLLFMFGTFWIAVALILLVPFILTWKKSG